MDQADTNLRNMLQLGIKAAQAKRKNEAYQLLSQVVQHDPQSEQGWLWLAAVAPTPQESLDAFGRVLMINPANEQARVGQRWATSRLNGTVVTPSAGSAPAPQTRPDVGSTPPSASSAAAPVAQPVGTLLEPGTTVTVAPPAAPPPANVPAATPPAASYAPGTPTAGDWRAAGDLAVAGGLNWDDDGSGLSGRDTGGAPALRGVTCPNCGAPGQTGMVCSLCNAALPVPQDTETMDPALRGAVFVPTGTGGETRGVMDDTPHLGTAETRELYTVPQEMAAVPLAADVAAPADGPYTEAIRPVARQTSLMPLLLGVILLLAGVLIAANGLLGSGGNRFDTAGQRFFQAQLKGDHSVAAGLLAPELRSRYVATNNDLPDLNLDAGLASVGTPAAVAQPAPLAIARDGRSGESYVTISGPQGSIRYLVHLSKVGDTWLVDQILPAR